MSATNLQQQYKASSHFDHIPLLPSFYALVSTLKHCMSRIGNMCIWELVVKVGTYCPLSTLGIYVMLIFLAMVVDVDWYVRFMKDVRVNF